MHYSIKMVYDTTKNQQNKHQIVCFFAKRLLFCLEIAKASCKAVNRMV